jgi:hypothetical protein
VSTEDVAGTVSSFLGSEAVFVKLGRQCIREYRSIRDVGDFRERPLLL